MDDDDICYQRLISSVTYYQQFGILQVGPKQYTCGVYPQSADKVEMYDSDRLMYALKTCAELVDGFNDDLDFSLASKENVGIYNFPGSECNIYLIDGDIYDWNFTFVLIRSTESVI